MYKKELRAQYNYTLPASAVLENAPLLVKDLTGIKACRRHIREHSSGWVIKGDIQINPCVIPYSEDENFIRWNETAEKDNWPTWVKEFEAYHPTYGRLIYKEKTITGKSKKAVDNFLKEHPLTKHYGDIIRHPPIEEPERAPYYPHSLDLL
jgi:hypothetical protein